ncbi:MAG: SCO family protein [Flavobacterium sp.]|nr:SCO family protein [Flavobacterium sp.]
MLQIFKKYRIFFFTMLGFGIIFLTISYQLLNPKKSLPIMNPSDVNPEMVDSTVQYKSKNHIIDDFSFTNQNGKTITQKDYEGKIYVADFFFTTCQSICPKMTANLLDVQKAFLNNPKVMLLSHSVTPDIDNVAVLKKYAIEKGVVDSKWNLVTGDKKAIYGIARKSYLAVKTSSTAEMYDMVHTENFILVDTKKRIRGFYDGTKPDDIQKLITDINLLLTEEN